VRDDALVFVEHFFDQAGEEGKFPEVVSNVNLVRLQQLSNWPPLYGRCADQCCWHGATNAPKCCAAPWLIDAPGGLGFAPVAHCLYCPLRGVFYPLKRGRGSSRTPIFLPDTRLKAADR
jgi:hypothetical protein